MAAPWHLGARAKCVIAAGVLWGLLAIGGCEDDSTPAGDAIPPDAPKDLAVTGVTTSSLAIRWIATGDDGSRGAASRYDIRYATTPPDGDSWWDSSTVTLPDPPAPRSAGEIESLTVRGLSAETDYFIAVRAADEESNWSPLSRIVSARTAGFPDTIPPSAVSDLAVESISDSSVTLVWTAPGDDGFDGTAHRYDMRYAAEEITEEDWDSAASVPDAPLPLPSGTVQRFEVTGLLPDRLHWFAIRSEDESANLSPLSNCPSGTPDGTPPNPIRDLRMTATTDSSVTLTWTAPDTPDRPGDAIEYDLRFSLEPVTEAVWDSAAHAPGLPAPRESGTIERAEIAGLAPQTIYYFAIKTGDRVPNWSAISNIALGRTQDSGGRTIRVAPDGSGDYATIQEAMDASVTGDIIELEDGLFSGAGNRGIGLGARSITVRSRSGDPSRCVLDCGGVARAFTLQAPEAAGSVLQGITIRNGLAGGARGSGGAVACTGEVLPSIVDCVFEGNRATEYGGALLCDGGARPSVVRCRFDGNSAGLEGGAIGTRSGSARVIECLFVHNEAGAGGAIGGWGSWRVTGSRFRENYAVGADAYESMGGAMSMWSSSVIEECVFDLNQAATGGAIAALFGWPTIRNCTFALNQAELGGAISLYHATLTIERVIIAFDLSAAPVEISDYLPTFVCSDMYGNQGGDWAGEFAGQELFQGNFKADPRFCDLEGGDLRIRPDSPCAAAGSGCGWVGGGAVGCGAAASDRPWLRLTRSH